MNANGVAKFVNIFISNGTLNVFGDMDFNGSSSETRWIDMSAGNGTVNLYGNCNAGTPSDLNSSLGSNFNYVGSGNQLMGGFNYANVKLSNCGIKTLINNATISGTLSLQGSSTFSLGGFGLTYGLLSTLEYKGSVIQNTGPELNLTSTPTNLIINNILGVNLMCNLISINGNLSLVNGAFNLNKNTFTVNNPLTSAITSSSTSYVISEDVSLTGGKANNASILRWNIGNLFGPYIFPFGNNEGDLIPLTI
jgi:hypothetical protein